MKKIANIIVFTTLFISNSPLLWAQKPTKKQNSAPLKTAENKANKKNAQGFWMNDIDSALKDATKNKKPLLIDFYGIWCPPCNQLDELVFTTTKFKAAAQKFVLLKLDADSEKSWVLKSKYNVGGYPTLLIIKVEDQQPSIELDRIVGYYPTNIITHKMSEALLSDGKTDKQKLVELIDKSISNSNDLGDDEAVLQYAKAGLAVDPQNLNFKLAQLTQESKKNKETLETKENQQTLKDLTENRKNLSVALLVQLFELKPNKEIFDELISRVNNETQYIDNEGYTAADIYAMAVDWTEEDKNDTAKKAYLDLTIESYEKLLKKYGEETRSTNLSYTYYLQKAGQFTKARNIYDKMLSKYPHEFTFYYQAADFALEQKDYSLAKHYIGKAMAYSYGDNKIRSYNKALKVAVAAFEARKTEEERNSLKTQIADFEKVIADYKKPEGINVRTDRYMKKLATAIEDAKKLL